LAAAVALPARASNKGKKRQGGTGRSGKGGHYR
jgi:hypothetical protein